MGHRKKLSNKGRKIPRIKNYGIFNKCELEYGEMVQGVKELPGKHGGLNLILNPYTKVVCTCDSRAGEAETDTLLEHFG